MIHGKFDRFMYMCPARVYTILAVLVCCQCVSFCLVFPYLSSCNPCLAIIVHSLRTVDRSLERQCNCNGSFSGKCSPDHTPMVYGVPQWSYFHKTDYLHIHLHSHAHKNSTNV